ncbi:MAG: Holliday junction ATP-dependent helicase ruvA [Firmicutes bacterium]|nr:Holliday junction ATP-dependent helicase ruvA [Bacillota bacterium]
MIGFLRGIVADLFVDHCFIDVHGVGYRVFISAATRQNLIAKEEVKLLTHLSVREDAMVFYGFSTPEEYELFQLLIAISGIGPKVALGVLSSIRPQEFQRAVSQKNAALLTKIPGIGKKTAERIILELKDKLGMPASPETLPSTETFVSTLPGDAVQEALAALIALGYSQSEAAEVIGKVQSEGKTVEELIRLALRESSGR